MITNGRRIAIPIEKSLLLSISDIFPPSVMSGQPGAPWLRVLSWTSCDAQTCRASSQAHHPFHYRPRLVVCRWYFSMEGVSHFALTKHELSSIACPECLKCQSHCSATGIGNSDSGRLFPIGTCLRCSTTEHSLTAQKIDPRSSALLRRIRAARKAPASPMNSSMHGIPPGRPGSSS